MIKGPQRKQYTGRQTIYAKPEQNESEEFSSEKTIEIQEHVDSEKIPSQNKIFSAVPKKRLLQQFCKVKGKKHLVTSATYLPPDLDKIVGDIAHERGKQFSRSHLLIESLMLHPDILTELRKRGILK